MLVFQLSWNFLLLVVGTIWAFFMLQALSFEILTLWVPLLNTYKWVALLIANIGYTLAVMQAFPSPPKLSTMEWSICKYRNPNANKRRIKCTKKGVRNLIIYLWKMKVAKIWSCISEILQSIYKVVCHNRYYTHSCHFNYFWNLIR